MEIKVGGEKFFFISVRRQKGIVAEYLIIFKNRDESLARIKKNSRARCVSHKKLRFLSNGFPNCTPETIKARPFQR
jgi:hypothetical protein